MFGFTDDAAVLIRSLIAGAELGADSGLRMSIDPQRRSLTMGLAAHPVQHPPAAGRVGHERPPSGT